MIQKIKLIFGSDMMMKKIIAYVLLAMFFYFLKDFLMLFLISFLFSFLSFVLAKNISNKLKTWLNKKNKIIDFLTSINFLVSCLYVIYIFGFIFFLTHLIPLLINELTNISKHVPMVSDYIHNTLTYLNQVQHTKETVSSDFQKVMTEKNINIVINTINHIKVF